MGGVGPKISKILSPRLITFGFMNVRRQKPIVQKVNSYAPFYAALSVVTFADFLDIFGYGSVRVKS